MSNLYRIYSQELGQVQQEEQPNQTEKFYKEIGLKTIYDPVSKTQYSTFEIAMMVAGISALGYVGYRAFKDL